MGIASLKSTRQCWSDMKQRCYNSNNSDYPNWGGKGITVCDRWLESFQNFLDDMGLKPDGLTLDRIDNTKGYGPDNCRWLSRKEQCQNRGERKTWAGVRFNKKAKKWEVRVQVYGEKKVLQFDTKEEADEQYSSVQKPRKALHK